MTQTWHADEETLRSWATGSAAPLLAASIEAHLLRCEECRRRTSSLSVRTIPDDTVRRWDALADRIDRPRSNPLLRLGLATPGLRTAWLASLLLLLALPVLVSVVGVRLPLFMALAPVAPLAAVALAYGRDAEPAGELALATPSAGLRVVSARAVLVALTAVPIGVGGALLLGERGLDLVGEVGFQEPDVAERCDAPVRAGIAEDQRERRSRVARAALTVGW